MDKYGLIGYPLGHSFSRGYFNEKFENEGIDAQYLNFEIPVITDLPQILAENPELKGLNVTIPYKEQIIPFLDELDKDALAIGAVNVVKVIPQKGYKYKLVGYNSDVIGFTQSIAAGAAPQAGTGPRHRRGSQSHHLRTEEAGRGEHPRLAPPVSERLHV